MPPSFITSFFNWKPFPNHFLGSCKLSRNTFVCCDLDELVCVHRDLDAYMQKLRLHTKVTSGHIFRTHVAFIFLSTMQILIVIKNCESVRSFRYSFLKIYSVIVDILARIFDVLM